MGSASYIALKEGFINACAHCCCSLLVIITNSCLWSATVEQVRRHRRKWWSWLILLPHKEWLFSILPCVMHIFRASFWTHNLWGSQNNFWRSWDDALDCSQPWLREPWGALHCKQDSKVRSWHLCRSAVSPPRIEFCLTVLTVTFSQALSSHIILSPTQGVSPNLSGSYGNVRNYLGSCR